MKFIEYEDALTSLKKIVESDPALKKNEKAMELLEQVTKEYTAYVGKQRSDYFKKYKTAPEFNNTEITKYEKGRQETLASDFTEIYNLFNKNKALEKVVPGFFNILPSVLQDKIRGVPERGKLIKSAAAPPVQPPRELSDLSKIEREAREVASLSATEREARLVADDRQDANIRAEKRRLQRKTPVQNPKSRIEESEIEAKFEALERKEREDKKKTAAAQRILAVGLTPADVAAIAPKTTATAVKLEPDVAAAPAVAADDDDDEEIDEVIAVVPEGKIDSNAFSRAVQRFIAADLQTAKTREISLQLKSLSDSIQDLPDTLDISSKEVTEFIKLYNSFPLAEPADYENALPSALKNAIAKAKADASAAAVPAEPKPAAASVDAAAAPIIKDEKATITDEQVKLAQEITQKLPRIDAVSFFEILDKLRITIKEREPFKSEDMTEFDKVYRRNKDNDKPEVAAGDVEFIQTLAQRVFATVAIPSGELKAYNDILLQAIVTPVAAVAIAPIPAVAVEPAPAPVSVIVLDANDLQAIEQRIEAVSRLITNYSNIENLQKALDTLNGKGIVSFKQFPGIDLEKQKKPDYQKAVVEQMTKNAKRLIPAFEARIKTLQEKSAELAAAATQTVALVRSAPVGSMEGADAKAESELSTLMGDMNDNLDTNQSDEGMVPTDSVSTSMAAIPENTTNINSEEPSPLSRDKFAELKKNITEIYQRNLSVPKWAAAIAPASKSNYEKLLKEIDDIMEKTKDNPNADPMAILKLGQICIIIGAVLPEELQPTILYLFNTKSDLASTEFSELVALVKRPKPNSTGVIGAAEEIEGAPAAVEPEPGSVVAGKGAGFAAASVQQPPVLSTVITEIDKAIIEKLYNGNKKRYQESNDINLLREKLKTFEGYISASKGGPDEGSQNLKKLKLNESAEAIITEPNNKSDEKYVQAVKALLIQRYESLSTILRDRIAKLEADAVNAANISIPIGVKPGKGGAAAGGVPPIAVVDAVAAAAVAAAKAAADTAAKAAALVTARDDLVKNEDDMDALKTHKEMLEDRINSLKTVKELEDMKTALQAKVKDWKLYETDLDARIDKPANKTNPAYRQAFAEKMVENARELIPIVEARIKQLRDEEAKRNAAPPPAGDDVDASLVANSSPDLGKLFGRAAAASSANAAFGGGASITARPRADKLIEKDKDGKYKKEDLERLKEQLKDIQLDKDPTAQKKGLIAAEMIDNIDRYLHWLEAQKVSPPEASPYDGDNNQLRDQFDISLPSYDMWVKTNHDSITMNKALQAYKEEVQKSLAKIEENEKNGFKYFNKEAELIKINAIQTKIVALEHDIEKGMVKFGKDAINLGKTWGYDDKSRNIDPKRYDVDKKHAEKTQKDLQGAFKKDIGALRTKVNDLPITLSSLKAKKEFTIGTAMRKQFKKTKALQADSNEFSDFNEYVKVTKASRNETKSRLSEWTVNKLSKAIHKISFGKIGTGQSDSAVRREAHRDLYQGVVYKREKEEPGRVMINLPEGGTIQQYFDAKDRKAKIIVDPPGDKAVLIMLDNCQKTRVITLTLPHVGKELAKSEDINKEDMMNVLKTLAASRQRGGIPLVEINDAYRKILSENKEFGKEFVEGWNAIKSISDTELEQLTKDKEYTLSGLVNAITKNEGLSSEAGKDVSLGKAPNTPKSP